MINPNFVHNTILDQQGLLNLILRFTLF